VDILFGVPLHRYGIDAHAGRNTARLALAAELPASVLADLTGISISTAERWSQWAKRDWAAYLGQRATDVNAGRIIGCGSAVTARRLDGRAGGLAIAQIVTVAQFRPCGRNTY